MLLIARLVEHHTLFAAADVLALVRSNQPDRRDSIWALATACIRPRTPKHLQIVASEVASLTRDAKRIYVFDRGNSFAYLRPPLGNKSNRDIDARVLERHYRQNQSNVLRQRITRDAPVSSSR